MPKFRYKARDEFGALKTGSVEASSRDEAIQRIRGDRLTVMDLRSEHDAVDLEAAMLRQAAKGVKREEVISFTSQLSVMLETGVPLAEALDAYMKQSRGSLARVVGVVSGSVTGGASLSAAIASFPKVFPKLMVSLLRASEASGTMALMLGRVADYLQKERQITKQIRGAMTYPLVMVAMALGVTGFLTVWVLPRFAKIYQSRDAALPVLTQFVLSTSEFIRMQWPAIIAGAVIITALGYLFVRSKSGRRFVDKMKITVPVLGPMYSKYYLARATRTLGTLLIAGVTLVDSVRIVRGITRNVLWDEFWDDLINTMTDGGAFSEAIVETELIPPSVAQMIAAGERSGRLPEVLSRVAEMAEAELDEAIKTGTQLIEPAMIMVMGVLIGGIAIALLLPIFTISSAMAG